MHPMAQAMICAATGAFAAVSAASAAETKWLPASADKLPLWRGFNLLGKFHREWRNGPFLEEDFRLISELGFNFVRLPMDYRTWVRGDDWRSFDEAVLKEIDQAVEWGGQYGVHVSINFHRAPGYTVASPKEKTDLWTDAETQEVCALHWATFARRYKGIPNERLSLNLFNEPSKIDGATYYRVAKVIVDAIRKEDPARLIIADGLSWAKAPCKELYPLRVAQATRGYTPFYISHYKAGWAGSWDGVPPPDWPRAKAIGWLAGDGKKDLQKPLVIDGPFPSAADLRLRVAVVSARAHLLVEADGNTVLDKLFEPGEGEGEWKKSVFKPQWNIYQNVYDRDYEARIPAGTQRVVVRVQEGDWMTLSGIGIRPEGTDSEASLALITDYGKAPVPVRYHAGNTAAPFSTPEREDRAWLWKDSIEPWLAAQEAGVGVMVGEFGAYNKTPHAAVLRWLEDCLANWKKAGWGWAMWNFRGSFGVLDSGRADVEYEDFRGHKLDRKMLDLLLKYR